MWGSLLDTCTYLYMHRPQERMRRAAGQDKERRGVPDKIDAQAPVVSMRATRSCRAQCNMLTTASRISESLVGRSCLSLPVVSLLLFFRVWRRMARDGRVIREGGRGQQNNPYDPYVR